MSETIRTYVLDEDKTRPKAARANLLEGDDSVVVIYTRRAKTGTPVGDPISLAAWVEILEDLAGITRLEGTAQREDGVAATVRDLDDARTARKRERIADLVQRRDRIDAKIAEMKGTSRRSWTDRLSPDQPE